MPKLFKSKIKVIYKDREGREHTVIRRIWEKKNENEPYYVTAIQITYPSSEMNVAIENHHTWTVPEEWEFVRKEYDYIRQIEGN